MLPCVRRAALVRRGLPHAAAASHLTVQVRWTSTEASDACERVTKLGAGANIALCGLKGVAGTMTGSTAMIADAFHSLGDLVSDAVTLAAIKYSRDPPDEKFPFGKGKLESLGALCVSGLLVGTSFGIGSVAWAAITTAEPFLITGPAALTCGVISVVVKEALYRITVKAGKEANSSVTVANAHHHRSDAYSSVVAVVGIAGNMCGVSWLDPVAGAVVAAMILRTGCEIGVESMRDLLDQHSELDDDTMDAVRAICKKYNVKGFEVRARKMGPYYSLYVTVAVRSTISVSVASQVTESIRADILAQCEEVQSCFIASHAIQTATSKQMPDHDELKAAVLKVLSDVAEILTVTHFTPHYLSGNVSVNLDVTMDSDKVATIEDATKVARRAEKAILAQLPQVQHADIHLELRSTRRRCESLHAI